MLRAHTGTAVRAAEQPLLEAGQGDALMRRAAWGLAQHVLAELRRRGPVAGSTVAALVGSGNNGGDALWALSFLRRRGVHTVAVPASRSRALHDDGHAALLAAGGQVGEQIPSGATVVIDGILGTGARGAFELPDGLVLPEGVTVVACDVPSGVDADTGRVLGEAIPAEVTVTFGAVKTGLLLGTRRDDPPVNHAVLSFCCPFFPSASTRRSRGRESTAVASASGSRRTSSMVSERLFAFGPSA